MEEKQDLLEEIILNMPQDKKRISTIFWLNFLKKSWPVYGIMIVFTIVFVVLYVLSGNLFQFYLSIFYPIVLFLFLIGEGIYKNVKIIQSLKQEYSNLVHVSIYATCISFENQYKGIQHKSVLPYKIMENIKYNSLSKEIIFEIHKKKYFSIPKEDIKEETFHFFLGLTSQKKDKEDEI